ncbi:hypothetical protein SAMN04489727_4031 [Amycolatopsis tolypomycina]|uniref:Uncharacterized protein n=1 Tax=Amycolatopsis tolypomycina TaxID=208445 RepID=A0A1H4T4T7_9PSEU|nr:hypothetical protein SAMN04489727_4031 [Amycolatopsis tolypomycina]
MTAADQHVMKESFMTSDAMNDSFMTPAAAPTPPAART